MLMMHRGLFDPLQPWTSTSTICLYREHLFWYFFKLGAFMLMAHNILAWPSDSSGSLSGPTLVPSVHLESDTYAVITLKQGF